VVQHLAEPIRRFEAMGGRLAYSDLSRIVKDAGGRLDNLDQRWRDGSLLGEVFKVFFALANHQPEWASWAHAARIVERGAAAARVPAARTSIMGAKQRLLSVAHLWGAYSIRGRKWQAKLEVNYTYTDDVLNFLAEAEILRNWGQGWKANAAKAKPPLPAEVWEMPATWVPPFRKPGWPATGMIPDIELSPEMLSPPGARGRPRRNP
jgi:hypothetical protein